MTNRAQGRRGPLLVLVAAVLALLSSIVWATGAIAGPGGTGTPWSPMMSGPAVGMMPMAPGSGYAMPGMAGVGDEASYLTHMVAHHQEAVEAARQLERSERGEMRTLGASIVTGQSAEIATMKAWLAAWYPGRSPEIDYRPMMRDLSTLSGDALDEVFLRDMIPHHMAAVMMSQQLLVRGDIEHQELVGFARTVRDAQHAEIFQMRRYLGAWFGGGRGPMANGSRITPGGSSDACGRGGPWGPGGMMGW
ncbi:MAG: DUF305 domain-containing protein [Pseudonocardia sp.]|jgi:uncharacterized protein (DUF305 family)